LTLPGPFVEIQAIGDYYRPTLENSVIAVHSKLVAGIYLYFVTGPTQAST